MFVASSKIVSEEKKLLKGHLNVLENLVKQATEHFLKDSLQALLQTNIRTTNQLLESLRVILLEASKNGWSENHRKQMNAIRHLCDRIILEKPIGSAGMEKIPNFILEKILLKLPRTVALRARSISKSWNTAFSRIQMRSLVRTLDTGILSFPWILRNFPTTDNGGNTLLHLVAQAGNEVGCQFLLERSTSIHTQNRQKLTPLHLSAMQGHRKVCQTLLDQGAKTEERDIWGSTPLHWAVNEGHFKVCEMLLLRGANIEAQDMCGNTPLHWAAQRGHKKVCQLLLSEGANISATDKRDRTPLYWSYVKREEEIYDLLLNRAYTKSNDFAKIRRTIEECQKYAERSHFSEVVGEELMSYPHFIQPYSNREPTAPSYPSDMGRFYIKQKVLLFPIKALENLDPDDFWDFIEEYGVKNLVIHQANGELITHYEERVLKQLIKRRPEIEDLTKLNLLRCEEGKKLIETKANLLLCGDYFELFFQDQCLWKMDKRLAFDFSSCSLTLESVQEILKEVRTGECDLYDDDVYEITCNYLQYSKFWDLPEGTFGPKQWREYYGIKIRKAPPVPLALLKKLNEPCTKPIRRRNRTEVISGNHTLILIPEGMTLKIMGKLAKNPIKGYKIDNKYRYKWDKSKVEHANTPNRRSHWILVETFVPPEIKWAGSENFEYNVLLDNSYSSDSFKTAVGTLVIYTSTGKKPLREPWKVKSRDSSSGDAAGAAILMLVLSLGAFTGFMYLLSEEKILVLENDT